MKRVLISATAALLVLAGCATQNSSNNQVSKSETKLSMIRKGDLTADSENLPKIEYNAPAPAPGVVKPYKKSFVTAPPMIPHSIEGMVPIKVGNNQCLMCHMPEAAKGMGVKPMPKDHFVDNFSGNKKTPKVAGSRYFCTTCHTPQAKLDPVVENKFESLKTW